MNDFKSRTFGRIAVASVLSFGLTAGAVSIASAATPRIKGTNHASVKAHTNVAFLGTVTGMPSGSVTVMNAKGVSETFTVLTTTDLIRSANVNNAAVVAMGDRVLVRASAKTPTVASSVNILGVKTAKHVAFQGKITALLGDSVTIMNAKGKSEMFSTTTATAMLSASNVKIVALVTGERVQVRALASAPTVATSIKVFSAKK